jgi:hypothetical protein
VFSCTWHKDAIDAIFYGGGVTEKRTVVARKWYENVPLSELDPNVNHAFIGVADNDKKEIIFFDSWMSAHLNDGSYWSKLFLDGIGLESYQKLLTEQGYSRFGGENEVPDWFISGTTGKYYNSIKEIPEIEVFYRSITKTRSDPAISESKNSNTPLEIKKSAPGGKWSIIRLNYEISGATITKSEDNRDKDNNFYINRKIEGIVDSNQLRISGTAHAEAVFGASSNLVVKVAEGSDCDKAVLKQDEKKLSGDGDMTFDISVPISRDKTYSFCIEQNGFWNYAHTLKVEGTLKPSNGVSSSEITSSIDKDGNLPSDKESPPGNVKIDESEDSNLTRYLEQEKSKSIPEGL